MERIALGAFSRDFKIFILVIKPFGDPHKHAEFAAVLFMLFANENVGLGLSCRGSLVPPFCLALWALSGLHESQVSPVKLAGWPHMAALRAVTDDAWDCHNHSLTHPKYSARVPRVSVAL